MKIISSAAVVIASLLFVQQALAQINSEPAKNGPVFHAGNNVPKHLVQKRRLAEQQANSFDQGDFYLTPGGKHDLHRLADSVVLRFSDAAAKTNALAGLTMAGGALSGYETDFETPQGWVVLRQNSVRGKIVQSGLAQTAQAIAVARGVQGVRAARPLFVDPPSGLWMVPTDEIIVRLKPGVDPQDYFGANWPKARLVGGTTDQFVLTLPDMTAEEMLAETQRRAGDARVIWCQPDFISQEVSQVNDSLYPLQWPLNNTGQTGAKTNTDINAPEAWLITTGSTNIVIAVLDDAVQTAHPDLSANIFHNTADPIDGVDNDGNGYVDDFTGWDFLGNDSDPNPVLADDSHGTAVAGLAAGVGNNNLGVAGVAYTCKILPVKGVNISDSRRAEMFYYAAGRATNGIGTWRGADIINHSLSRPQSLVVDDALHWAATSGRGGKGCAIFVSSGNQAANWALDFINIPSAGIHTITWAYVKDTSDLACDDTAWLDSVMFSDGTVETFESGGLPSGWTTGGDANWSNVQDGVGGNHALTGWSGPGSRALRAGTIGNTNFTYVDVTRNLPAGFVLFWYWVSSEEGFDSLNVYLDGVFQYPRSGCFPQTTAVSYPATHPDVIGVGASTDFDFRSDFSQYGTNLSLVAPGGGGQGRIYTTDRTGTNGFNSGDYETDFSGTSASCPIAAGVGALVLSVNPTLTAKEVRSILQDSCDKIGGVTYTNGWHPYFGYGRVNAQAALALALPKISSARITANDVRVRFNSLTNRIYQLQRRDSLDFTSAWTNVSSATNVAGNGLEVEAVDAGGYGQNTRFYRVRQLPSP